MRKLLVGICATVVFMTMLSRAQGPEVVPLSAVTSTDVWFIELSGAPTIDGTDLAQLEREESAFHAAALAALHA